MRFRMTGVILLACAARLVGRRARSLRLRGINARGFRFLARVAFQMAVAVFEFNVRCLPGSDNACQRHRSAVFPGEKIIHSRHRHGVFDA